MEEEQVRYYKWIEEAKAEDREVYIRALRKLGLACRWRGIYW
jgi:hypothetical protein